LREWVNDLLRTLFRRGVWFPFNDPVAEFAELILVGEDGEEERHENEDFPKDKGELCRDRSG
jgi:hypothetical protein